MARNLTINDVFIYRLGLFVAGISVLIIGLIRAGGSEDISSHLIFRIIVSGIPLICWLLSFRLPQVKENLSVLSLVNLYILVGWLMFMAYLNQFQLGYWASSLVAFSVGGFFYKHPKAVIVTSSGLLILMAIIKWVVFPETETLWLFPTLFFFILVLQIIVVWGFYKMDKEVAYLADFTASSPMPVIEVNRDMDIVYRNEAALREFPFLISHKATHPLLLKLKDGFETLEEEGTIKDVDIPLGEKAYEAQFYFVQEPRTYRCYITQISPRKEFEAARTKARMEELQRVERELKERNEQMDLFLYKATHDLKGPLTSVMGILNIAIQDCTQPEVRKYIELALASTSRLDNSLLDLIHVTRINKEQVRPENIDCHELLKEVLQSINHIPERKNAEISVEVPAGLKLRSDRNTLLSVFQNLITNALKYRREGSHIHEVNIAVTPKDEGVEIHVTDNGEGIRPEIQEKIFTMFYRGNKKSKGTGLGLYIVRQSVAKLSGKVSVKSQPGKGSEFDVWLPNLPKG